ncbi:rho guanine nucleotide exchange factor 17-like [Babylonia areolata]|uniref:rho guanine nucleotide exchange factor 17-like n=1 Tax=Babylonia areolata TaxID=304850 RepID=UPI003FCF8107
MEEPGEGRDSTGGDQEESTVPSSPTPVPTSAGVLSPKVARPKLPAFASSPSPQVKKDSGRENLQTILEDIEKLRKFNFDEFRRPRHQHPSAFATLPRKSQSARASPIYSPRISSPTVDDPGSSRDRLKMLTSYLKNKSSKLLSEQTPVGDKGVFAHEGSVPANFKASDIVSPEGLSKEKVAVAEEGTKSLVSVQSRDHKVSPSSLIRISPRTMDSLNTKQVLSPADRNTPDFGSVSQNDNQTQPVNSHSHAEPHIASQTLGKTWEQDAPDTHLKISEEEDRTVDPGIAAMEDEGVSEILDSPRSAVDAPFHTVMGLGMPLWTPTEAVQQAGSSSITATESERAGQGESPPLLGEEEAQEREEETSNRSRFQRRGDSSANGKQKGTTRFITHPPHAKAQTQEEGPVDSNGFVAFKTPADADDDPIQQSQTSLADSQLTAEETENLTFQDVINSMAGGQASESSDSDKQEKKSVKLAKQKSRSDPSGNRLGENLEFVPTMDTNQSHSAPVLVKGEKDPWITDDDHVSTSDGTLSPSRYSVATEKSEEQTSGNEDFDTDDSVDGSEILGSHESSGVPQSNTPPFSLSPDSSARSSRDVKSRSPPEQRSLLTVPPASVSHRRIPRSASSASEFQARKHREDAKRKDRDKGAKPRSDGRALSEFIPLGDSGAASSMPSVWKEQLSFTESPERELGFIKDKRYHIIEELYRNEKEYVDALRLLKEKYMGPLKNSSNVDDTIVDNIFYMIPEILMHHAVYLDLLDKVWKNWDSRTSTIGDKILAIFSKQTVLESYMSFVENYNTSGKVIENALTTKSSMQKFIEQCQRDSGSKLSMKDLIVRPIQRIPRYELLIQRLLDNTPVDHPDHPLLQRACRAMHDLALKIGTVTHSQHEEDMQETLKKLELLLITDLVAPDRAYMRHDMVHLVNKKDPCCVWLFTDLIILSSVKRKSGPVTRKVSIILKTPGGQDFTENIKHKVWLKAGLDCLEIVKPLAGALNHRPAVDREQLERDIEILGQITDLCSGLVSTHQNVDEAVRELNTSLTQQLAEATLRSIASESSKVELLVTTQEGVLNLEMGFTSAEKRAAWETAFTDAKNKLSMLTNKRAPEFLQPLQITKTRAGMQFSCAAPIDGVSGSGGRDVWVCNSDGYVGHMCLLSLQPEPIVTLNTPVPGCNARILCICAVPAFAGGFRRRSSQRGHSHQDHDQHPLFKLKWPDTEEAVEDSVSSSGIDTGQTQGGGKRGGEEDEDNTEEGYQSDSESSDDDDDDDDDDDFHSSVPFLRNNDLFVGDLLSDEEITPPRVSEMTANSPDPFSPVGTWVQDPHKSTMWLGTEDGCIHIFQCTDNIKTTKNKLRIQHGSPVHCIVYLDNKVFVSLVNGDLIVYKRDSEGLWDTEHPYTRTIGSVTAPITRMLPVAGKLWCGCQNSVHVINPLTLNTELSFQVMSDASRAVQCMVCAGQGVWVACQHSAKISLFHATTFEFLLEVSIAQAVSQKLQSADDIIRQHKAACLRVTALLVCKDLLWVGTSAGVILTLPLPNVTSTTTHGALASPAVTGLVYGHTGHVRFLTAVELWGSGAGQKNSEGAATKDTTVLPEIHRRSSVAAPVPTMATRMLVISGGDGYEDFRNSSASDAAGRDDSTNHLLLWQV